MSSREPAAATYATIVADPPWPLKRGGSAPTSTWGHPRPGIITYDQMTVAQIAALPVGKVARQDAHLYLWTINAHIEASYSVARAWGFRPVTLLTWAKAPRGIGLGGAYVQTTEHILFCRRGKLSTLRRIDSTWWNWKRPYDSNGPLNSVKPEEFQDVVESVSPGPYLELFARRRRPGWDVWGNEVASDVELVA